MSTYAPFAKPLYVMLKPVGAVCNLACDYCYYLEKSKLYRDNPKHVMSEELLEKFIEEYINSQTMPQVLFTWHGGETLMRPLSFYKRAMELQRKYANGRTIDNTFTAGEKIEPVRVERRPYQYLYEDDMGCNFMHTETFEQIVIDKNLIDNSDLMKEGQVVEVMFHTEKETVLSAELPPIVDMEVTYTEPGIKGDTASTNSLKPATVNTGATVRVPLFINTGDKIRVDTRTREYYERIK